MLQWRGATGKVEVTILQPFFAKKQKKLEALHRRQRKQAMKVYNEQKRVRPVTLLPWLRVEGDICALAFVSFSPIQPWLWCNVECIWDGMYVDSLESAFAT